MQKFIDAMSGDVESSEDEDEVADPSVYPRLAELLEETEPKHHCYGTSDHILMPASILYYTLSVV